jgi:hypothetical protein
MRHRSVSFRSSSQRSPDALLGRLFLGRSPPRLLIAAAPGGLKPTPESRLRGPSPIFDTALQVFTHIRDTPQNRILTRSFQRREPCPRFQLTYSGHPNPKSLALLRLKFDCLFRLNQSIPGNIVLTNQVQERRPRSVSHTSADKSAADRNSKLLELLLSFCDMRRSPSKGRIHSKTAV